MGGRRAVFAGCVSACLVLGQPAIASDASRIIALDRADGATTRVRTEGPSGGCPPTIIFSHGLGDRIGGNSALMSQLADRGWRILALEHVESGPAALAGMTKAEGPGHYFRERAGDPHRHQARFADLDAAYREATRSCRPTP